MFFFFTCGEHTFRKEVPGYEGKVCQCHHCGNMAGRVIKSNPFFTFCFIVRCLSLHLLLSRLTLWQPIIPLSIHGYKDVSCRICNFHQPLENRPDVIALATGGAPQVQQPQQQGPPQAYGGNGQPPPPTGNKPPHYG